MIPVVERKLEKLRLEIGKDFNLKLTNVIIYANGKKLFNAKDTNSIVYYPIRDQEKEYLDFYCSSFISGDVKVEFTDESKDGPCFFFCFHVSFVDGYILRVGRMEIDGIHKEKHKSKVGDLFFLEAHFHPNYKVIKGGYQYDSLNL